MSFIFYGCIGFIIGVIVSKLVSKSKTIGSLRMDNSDPDSNPYLFLELEKTLVIFRRKRL